MDIHTKRLSKAEQAHYKELREKSIAGLNEYGSMSIDSLLIYIQELEEKLRDNKEELIKDLYKDIEELNEELKEYRK